MRHPIPVTRSTTLTRSTIFRSAGGRTVVAAAEESKSVVNLWELNGGATHPRTLKSLTPLPTPPDAVAMDVRRCELSDGSEMLAALTDRWVNLCSGILVCLGAASRWSAVGLAQLLVTISGGDPLVTAGLPLDAARMYFASEPLGDLAQKMCQRWSVPAIGDVKPGEAELDLRLSKIISWIGLATEPIAPPRRDTGAIGLATRPTRLRIQRLFQMYWLQWVPVPAGALGALCLWKFHALPDRTLDFILNISELEDGGAGSAKPKASRTPVRNFVYLWIKAPTRVLEASERDLCSTKIYEAIYVIYATALIQQAVKGALEDLPPVTNRQNPRPTGSIIKK
ncbi:hypothetical protein BDK51DRAFT_38440 [Blyttiomyces helicus]|uniref:Uncharacterized protein n=1 Tax=Blyttiomyces helicus TaxID=388810 RepID=A0A4P9W467_9FUNG|nr:hypothetical protein BDK51DRAFT_38440 [Blyttiomyces helicus]|eukprot:RKO87139.1 hypothetical protein BDK51DRAFT_38440 [Blyttiomyces helicus]